MFLFLFQLFGSSQDLLKMSADPGIKEIRLFHCVAFAQMLWQTKGI